MKVILTTLFLLTGSTILFGQVGSDKITDSIVQEGRTLYKSEMASWYGTDIFLEKFKTQRENIGGYFSYSQNDLNNCIFFSKGDQPKVLGTISFDSTYNVANAKVDGKERDFSEIEHDIYTIRKLALNEIKSDTLFKTYKNTNLNIIPLIDKGQKRVYVLTGPKVNGVVVFGNDYLLSFDKHNKLVNKERLHVNIIPINYGQKEGNESGIAMHSHSPETGDFISATDICTLMLYEKSAKWKQHYVISGNYVSIWDCERDELITLTKQAWENINKDQEERQKSKQTAY